MMSMRMMQGFGIFGKNRDFFNAKGFINAELGMLNAECGMMNAECGMMNAES